MQRKEPLKTGHIYHIFNRSIAGYRIFNSDQEYSRMLQAICHYQRSSASSSLSLRIKCPHKEAVPNSTSHYHEYTVDENLADIIAYCLMPTHFHLILKQQKEDGISRFIGNVQNSYARHFNLKHKRQGPLWAGKFKNVLIDSDEQLLHLTRYIHLNPTTSNLTQKPECWTFSSYKEYTSEGKDSNDSVCQFRQILEISPNTYRVFTEDRVSYQKELALIKHLTLE